MSARVLGRCLPLLLLAGAAPARRAPGEGPRDGGAGALSAAQGLAHPVEITSEHFTVDRAARQAIWLRNVTATRGDTQLRCNKLVAFYGDRQDIRRLECEGDVLATRGDKVVRGQKADFDNLAGVLVLTGQPEAESGPNRMSGDELRFDVTRDLLEVKPARTVFQSEGKALPLGAAGRPGAPLEILSDTFLLESERREATWLGHVRAKRGATRLTCGRLWAQYSESGEVRRVLCTRGVEARDGSLWAKGERAELDPRSDVLVVTGSPEARDGPNHLRGSKVTLYPGQNRVEVLDAVTVFQVPKEKGLPERRK